MAQLKRAIRRNPKHESESDATPYSGLFAASDSVQLQAWQGIAAAAVVELVVVKASEIAVLRQIAAGNANKQIADQLSVTEETVKGRVKNILSRLGANDRTQTR